MADVQRFKAVLLRGWAADGSDLTAASFRPDDDGECVYYRDYKAIQARVTKLEAAGNALRTAHGQDALAQAEEEWDALIEQTAQSGKEVKP